MPELVEKTKTKFFIVYLLNVNFKIFQSKLNIISFKNLNNLVSKLYNFFHRIHFFFSKSSFGFFPFNKNIKSYRSLLIKEVLNLLKLLTFKDF